jgi:hypothetical protein
MMPDIKLSLKSAVADSFNTLSIGWPIYSAAIEPDGGIHIAAVSKASEDPTPLWAHCGPAPNLGIFLSRFYSVMPIFNMLQLLRMSLFTNEFGRKSRTSTLHPLNLSPMSISRSAHTVHTFAPLRAARSTATFPPHSSLSSSLSKSSLAKWPWDGARHGSRYGRTAPSPTIWEQIIPISQTR